MGGFDYPEVDKWTPLADAYRYSVAEYPVRDASLLATSTIWTGSQLLEWGGYRLGVPPDPGVCPPNTGCDPIGPPSIYTNEGFVYTPAP